MEIINSRYNWSHDDIKIKDLTHDPLVFVGVLYIYDFWSIHCIYVCIYILCNSIAQLILLAPRRTRRSKQKRVLIKFLIFTKNIFIFENCFNLFLKNNSFNKVLRHTIIQYIHHNVCCMHTTTYTYEYKYTIYVFIKNKPEKLLPSRPCQVRSLCTKHSWLTRAKTTLFTKENNLFSLDCFTLFTLDIHYDCPVIRSVFTAIQTSSAVGRGEGVGVIL